MSLNPTTNKITVDHEFFHEPLMKYDVGLFLFKSLFEDSCFIDWFNEETQEKAEKITEGSIGNFLSFLKEHISSMSEEDKKKVFFETGFYTKIYVAFARLQREGVLGEDEIKIFCEKVGIGYKDLPKPKSSQKNTSYISGIKEEISRYTNFLLEKPSANDQVINKATALDSIGFQDKAIKALQDLASLDSNNFPYYQYLGDLLLKNKQYPEAIESYKKSLNQDSKDSYSIYKIGVTFTRMESYKESLPFLIKALKITPNNHTYFSSLITILKKTLKNEKEVQEELVKILKNFIKEDDENETYYNVLGEVYRKLGDLVTIKDVIHPSSKNLKKENYEKALKSWKKASSLDPLSPILCRNVGIGYIKNENYKKAIEKFERFLKLSQGRHKDNLDSRIYAGGFSLRESGTNLIIETHTLLGQLYDVISDYKNSSLHYKKAIKLQPNKIEHHKNLGDTFLKLKDFKRVITSFLKIMELDAHNLIYPNLGILDGIENNSGNYEGIIKELKKELKSDSENPILHGNIGICYYKNDDYNNALNYLSKAIDLDPSNVRYHWLLDKLHHLVTNYEALIKSYKKGLELDSSASIIHGNMGDLLMRSGDISEAIKYLEEAVKIESLFWDKNSKETMPPESEKYNKSLVKLLLQKKKYSEAIVYLKKCPDDSRTFQYLYGEALKGSGRFKEAKKMYEQSLKYPKGLDDFSNETIEKSLERITEYLAPAIEIEKKLEERLANDPIALAYLKRKGEILQELLKENEQIISKFTKNPG